MKRKYGFILILGVLVAAGLFYSTSAGPDTPEQHELEIYINYTGSSQLDDAAITPVDGRMSGETRVEEPVITNSSTYRLGELSTTKVTEFTTDVNGSYNISLEFDVETGQESRAEGLDIEDSLKIRLEQVEVTEDRRMIIQIESVRKDGYWRLVQGDGI